MQSTFPNQFLPIKFFTLNAFQGGVGTHFNTNYIIVISVQGYAFRVRLLFSILVIKIKTKIKYRTLIKSRFIFLCSGIPYYVCNTIVCIF